MLRHHPWIFSGAVAQLNGAVEPGGTVEVQSAGGDFLAWAGISPKSKIIARIWSWKEDQVIDELFFRNQIQSAINKRTSQENTRDRDAVRWINAEADGLPGIIVDRYLDTLVVQFLTMGVERWREEIIRGLSGHLGISRIIERSDVDIRTLEGLTPKKGLILGEALHEKIKIEENGVYYAVDVMEGHKTGFYLDQRENRHLIRQYAANKIVLDCFAYSGGFALNALIGGATSVTALEASGSGLALLEENIRLNQIDSKRSELIEGDVFKVLRTFRDQGRQFDLIVLDPPKFAQTPMLVQRASRGYKDINLLAFKLLRPGGILFTFSCSGGLSEELFQKIVADAALDAGVRGQIIHRLCQSADHPVALNFPESRYLKGFVIQVSR